MTKTQITLVQIDNYGPWTGTPEPRREVDLQTLQPRLYADLAQLVGVRDGYVFFTRFDNMIAVTNGIDIPSHKHIQESIGNRYPISVSLSIAPHSEPSQALGTASEQLQATESAQDQTCVKQLVGTSLADGHRSSDDVQIAHFDVNSITEKYTDQVNAFDTFIHIERGYAELMTHMYREYNALSFFVGGDNVIAVCPSMTTTEFSDVTSHIHEEAGVDQKVGVENAATAEKAGTKAKHTLEVCRDVGQEVCLTNR
jgi:GTP cyclohydrolase IIa